MNTGNYSGRTVLVSPVQLQLLEVERLSKVDKIVVAVK